MPVTEVVLHRVGVAMPGCASDLAQRDGIDSLLGEEPPSGVDQCVPTARSVDVHEATVTHEATI